MRGERGERGEREPVSRSASATTRFAPFAALAALVALPACGSNDAISPPGPDGWATASPASQGINPSGLDRADEVAAQLPSIWALIVVRHGYIVFERYYNGTSADTRPVIRSATKSVASAAYGVAIGRGELSGVDQRLEEAFPQHFGPGDDPKRPITVRHLLTMTSGLNSSEADGATRDTSWIRAYIGAPLVDAPGAVYRYDGALPHLLSGMLTVRTDLTLADYMQLHVFGPLGITDVTWESDPEGFTSGFSGLGIRARDLAKIGQVYVSGGVWDGRQVVPADWIEQSGVNQAPGGSNASGYGYLWYVTSETGHRAFYAAGYGGQYVYVIPALDLVVVITGDPGVTPDLPIFHRNLIPEFIVPAVR